MLIIRVFCLKSVFNKKVLLSVQHLTNLCLCMLFMVILVHYRLIPAYKYQEQRTSSPQEKNIDLSPKLQKCMKNCEENLGTKILNGFFPFSFTGYQPKDMYTYVTYEFPFPSVSILEGLLVGQFRHRHHLITSRQQAHKVVTFLSQHSLFHGTTLATPNSLLGSTQLFNDSVS